MQPFSPRSISPFAFNFLIFIPTLLVILSAPHDLLCQRMNKVVYNLNGLTPKDYTNKPDSAMVSEFWNNIKLLDSLEQAERKFRGETTFDFRGDEANSQNMFVFGGGLKLSRGTFPSQYKFIYNTGLTFTNNKITENISNIYASFDYHPGFGKRLPHEFFGFVNRFSDTYLGVDLRYELGGGYILQYWSNNHLLPKGKRYGERIHNIKYDNIKPKDEGLNTICKTFYEKNKLDTWTRDFTALQDVQQRMHNANIKSFARWRAGLLIGLFFEFEKITVTDSITSISGTESFRKEFEPTHQLRWELRPFLSWKLTEGVDFNWKTYFKLPMPGRERDVVTFGNQVSNWYDVRIDSELSLTATLSPPHVDDNKVVVGLSYNHYYDEAPQRYFIPDKVDAQGMNLLYSARRHHHLFRMRLGIEF